MQIGVAKELIDTVKPRVDQNKVGDTNNLTFYLDNDGNGVYTEGVDELVQKIAIKDGAKVKKETKANVVSLELKVKKETEANVVSLELKVKKETKVNAV